MKIEWNLRPELLELDMRRYANERTNLVQIEHVELHNVSHSPQLLADEGGVRHDDRLALEL